MAMMREQWLAEMRGEGRELLRKRDDQKAVSYHPSWVAHAVIWPVLGFAGVYATRTWSLRYHHPTEALLLGPVLGTLVCFFITWQAKLKFDHSFASRAAITRATCLWMALIAGCLCGDMNFHWYMSTYFDFQDLATYMNIDPLNDRGQSFMDAGQIYFKESTYVATTKAVAYVNNGIYCAAPIIRQPIENQEDNKDVLGALSVPPSGTFDFWAVGKDCCSGGGESFTCGEARNGKARAGLRMLRDDIRPFYMLAVQEWTAGLKLPAKHPLFFHWVSDPLVTVDKYYFDAQRTFGMHCLMFFVFDTLLVLVLLRVLFFMGVP